MRVHLWHRDVYIWLNILLRVDSHEGRKPIGFTVNSSFHEITESRQKSQRQVGRASSNAGAASACSYSIYVYSNAISYHIYDSTYDGTGKG